MTEPTIIASGMNEADRAAELHARCRAKLGEITAILDEANTHGMRIEFGLGMDGYGRNVIARMEVVKSLAR